MKLIRRQSLKEVLFILILIFSVELLSFYTGLPFTILDLSLLPISLLLIVMGIKSLIWGKPGVPKSDVKLTVLQLSYAVIVSICTFFLGLWGLLAGWQAPLTLFSGVRSGAYGYTLVSVGLLMAGYSLFLFFIFYFLFFIFYFLFFILMVRIKDRL